MIETYVQDWPAPSRPKPILLIGAVAFFLLGPGANVAFLVGLAFAVAASANLPAIVFSLFWRRFNTGGAVAGLATTQRGQHRGRLAGQGVGGQAADARIAPEAVVALEPDHAVCQHTRLNGGRLPRRRLDLRGR